MKKGFFKRALAYIGLGLTALGLVSCQSANPNAAVVIIDQPEVSFWYEEKTPGEKKRYATSDVTVKNDSIYDVTTWTFDYTVTIDDGVNPASTKNYKYEDSMFVAHGARGIVRFLTEVKDDNVTACKINSITRAQYRNVWETYLPWWIAGIVAYGLMTVYFAIQLFSGHVTSEEAKTLFQEHMASTFFGFSLVLLLCLFPLFFGSWVSTLILLGTFAASLLTSGILTLIKAKVAR